jgi:Zn-dependent peptidase ImmA (M78 family)
MRFGPRFSVLEAKWEKSWIEFSPALVAKWEEGVAQPTFAQVRKLAEIYRRPLAVFFLDSPPVERQTPPDLRTIRSQDNRLLSPDALLVMRQARRVQMLVADLYSELGDKPYFRFLPKSLNDDPIALGESIRNDLAVEVREQFGAHKFDEFFEYLRSRIESAGVITLKSGLHDSFPLEDCRAFSFADVLPFLILINNKDYEGAKNFSLAHELGHLLLRQPGVCNNFDSFRGLGAISAVEVFCNRFAASFLVPESQLRNHRDLRGRTRLDPGEIDQVTERLALDFKVSQVVILRRLLALELIALSEYKAKASKAEEIVRPRSSGGTFSLATILRKNGRAFSSLVFEAHQQNKISSASASDYLGVKTKHLASLEKLIQSHATG